MGLVFLHGVNNTPASWHKVITVMQARGWDCRSIFLPPYESVEAIAESVLAEVGSESVYLIGHSFGGMVALAVAAAAGPQVLGIALINSSAAADTDQTRAIRAERIAQAQQGGYYRLAAEASALTYHLDNLARADLQTARQSDIEHYGSERFIAHQKAMATRPDRTQFLSRFLGAKLAVIADSDRVITTENQQAMASRCGMSSVIIAQSGHMLPMEQPMAVAHALLDWLDAS